jgi:hypothetical protein
MSPSPREITPVDEKLPINWDHPFLSEGVTVDSSAFVATPRAFGLAVEPTIPAFSPGKTQWLDVSRGGRSRCVAGSVPLGPGLRRWQAEAHPPMALPGQLGEPCSTSSYWALHGAGLAAVGRVDETTEQIALISTVNASMLVWMSETPLKMGPAAASACCPEDWMGTG